MKFPRLVALFCVLALFSSCAETADPATFDDLIDRYGLPSSKVVEEPVAFTRDPYDFTGPRSIAQLIGLIPGNAFVWYGSDPQSPYPVAPPCDNRNNFFRSVDELPLTIEGIVTLHPRHFMKVSICGSEDRYYGTYILEDASGGIQVLKDSRISDFSYGDRVRLRVRGLMKYFDTIAVIAFDEEEVVSRGHAVSYEEIDRDFEESDIGRVKRVVGRISGEPTNQNFNEMCLVHPDDTSREECHKVCVQDSDCQTGECVLPFSTSAIGNCSRVLPYWLVSVDREIGQREPQPLLAGQLIEITAPVVDSFGLRMLIARIGQVTFLD